MVRKRPALERNHKVLLQMADINTRDIATLDPGEMMNDNIVTVLLREQPCQFPLIECLFYSILNGDQDGMFTSNRRERFKAAEKYFKPQHYQQDYVVIPIVRSYHWFLMIITPWHILVLDSLTWDLSTRGNELHLVNRYLDYMCSVNKLKGKHANLQHNILKVPLQDTSGNDCGIYIALFLKYFLQDIDLYESDPNSYIERTHSWFTSDQAHKERAEAKRLYKTLHALHVLKNR